MCRLFGNRCPQTEPEHAGASYQWALPAVRLSTGLVGSARGENKRRGPALLVVHPIKTFCIAAWQKKGGSQCSQTLFFSSLLCWRLRSCCGAADLSCVDGVGHAFDSGNPFAPSAARSRSSPRSCGSPKRWSSLFFPLYVVGRG